MGTNKIARDLLFYIVILIGVCGLIFTYRLLIGPLVIAMLLAYLLHPGVSWFAKHSNLDRKRIVPLVYIVFMGMMIFFVIYLSPIVLQQAKILTTGLQTIPDHIRKFELELEYLVGLNVPLLSYWTDLQSGANQLLRPERVFQIIQITTTNLVWLVVIFATSFYLLRDWERLRDWLIELAPQEYQPDVRHLYQETKSIWQVYLRGQLLIMLIVGLLSGTGAALIGLPGAVILGILAGTLALIPTLGPAITTVIVAAIAWTQGSTYLGISNSAMVILAAAIFQGVQIIEGVWLTPQIMGRRLRLHPGFVLIAIIGSLISVGATLALIILLLIGTLEITIRYTLRKRSGLDPWPIEEPSQAADASKYEDSTFKDTIEDSMASL